MIPDVTLNCLTPETWREALRETLKRRGLRQADLALACEVGHTAVERWFCPTHNGRTPPLIQRIGILTLAHRMSKPISA